MHKIFLPLLFASALFAQNPNAAVYPGRVATDSDLFVATNLGATTLNGALLTGATSMTLTSGVGFTAPVVVVIDSEIFHCTTLTITVLSGCTPGSEGTLQAAHSSGAPVKNVMTAWHHNQVAAEIKAIETKVNTLGGAGTLTTLSGNGPSWLTWTITNPTTTPAISLAPTTAQTSHQVIGTCGALTAFGPCALVAADLPATTVNAVTNDTNINGTISGQVLTFSWAGALAAARMANAGVHTGDAVGTFPAITLNTVNSNVGTFGDATHVAQVTVNGKGLVTAVANVATAAGGNTLTTVTFSATPTFTRTTANQQWAITLTGNVTSSTLSGASAGDILVFNIVQDATGARTFTWPTGFAEACAINPTASIGTKQTFYWDGTAAHAITPCVTTVSTSDQVLNDAANTGTVAFTLDASASTVANAVKVPVAAGATATANGAVAYDSTNNMLHAAQGAADAKIPQFTVTPTNGDCATWVVSGSNYKLGDSACGGGGSHVGPYWPFWNSTRDWYTNGFIAGMSSSTSFAVFSSPELAFSVNKIVFNVSTASGTACTGGTCGLLFTIYNSTCTSKIASTTALVSGGSPDINTTGFKTASFGSPVALTVGTLYCLSITSDSAALKLDSSDDSNNYGAIVNLNATRIGIAGNASTGNGAAITAPSSLGTLTTKTDGYGNPPAVMFE